MTTKECNFAIHPPSIGRFRVNAFIQQQCAGMVLRTITTKIPTFEGIGVTAGIKRCGNEQTWTSDICWCNWFR